jgi:hypothetical protein
MILFLMAGLAIPTISTLTKALENPERPQAEQASTQ